MAILDELKSAANVLRKADKIPEFEAILNAQQRILDLQEENAKLKEENRDLKQNNDFEKNLIFEKDAYYLIKSDSTKEGPYCPTCWGDENKKLRMRNLTDSYYCQKCQSYADL